MAESDRESFFVLDAMADEGVTVSLLWMTTYGESMEAGDEGDANDVLVV